MIKILLSILFGLFAPVLFFLGAIFFDVPGKPTPIIAFVVGSLSTALYLAACQFLVAKRESRRLIAKWPTIVAMATPLILTALITGTGSFDPGSFLEIGLPMLISGCFGVLVGAVLAGWMTLPAVSLKFCRRSLLICATLLAGIVVVKALVMDPRIRTDPFPGSNLQRDNSQWIVHSLNLLTAALFVFMAIRTRDPGRLSPTALSLLTFLVFVLACWLIFLAGVCLSHGPPIKTTSILLFLCSACEFFISLMVGTIVVRLPERIEKRDLKSPLL